MKHSLIILALLAAFGASAQEVEATAQSQAQSSAGAAADSRSGAVGNAVYIDQSGPTSQTVNANSTATVNEHYTGRVENVQSGTTNNNTSVHYSGTQTVKNVPGIAMSGPASGPCTGASGGLGLAGPGWGLGLNGAKVEPTCVVRENVRVIGMAMQSLDGAAYPQEKGELMLLMMDAVRGLGAMNQAIIGDNVGKKGGY
jgi:hypothetical protein